MDPALNTNIKARTRMSSGRSNIIMHAYNLCPNNVSTDNKQFKYKR